MGDSKVAGYSPLQRRLHWIVAILVASQFALQVPMRSAMRNLADSGTLDATGFFVTVLHTWGGVLVGALIVYRWHLRQRHPVPVAAGQVRGWQLMAAQTVHLGLYVVLLTMIVSGVLHYGLELEAAARWHELGKWVLIGLILVHVMAALWHHFVRKDQVLQRMLRR